MYVTNVTKGALGETRIQPVFATPTTGHCSVQQFGSARELPLALPLQMPR